MALGCSTHVAYVQAKCNGTRLCELLDASLITYNRKLDDISTAQVVIPINGDMDSSCCDCLGDVEPWCHQLTIVREGDGVVWTGPIQTVTYQRDTVTIDASDKLAWLQYRVNELSLCYSSACGGIDNTTIPMTEIAEDIMLLAMGDDGDSPCFLEDAQGNSLIIIVPGTPPNLSDGRPIGFDRQFFFESFAGPTAFDDLAQIAEAGIDFTVFNHNVILMSEDLPTRAIGILTDELILGDVSIIKDGTSMGNRFYVRYDGDGFADDDPAVCLAQCNAACACTCAQCSAVVGEPCYTLPCPAIAETSEVFCYGRIERVIDGTAAQKLATAQGIAELYLERGKIAPRQIEMPAGTRLSPETPWSLNDMICGQRVDVAISKLCLPVFQSFKLQGVEVTADGTDESITIDLLAVEQTNE